MKWMMEHYLAPVFVYSDVTYLFPLSTLFISHQFTLSHVC